MLTKRQIQLIQLLQKEVEYQTVSYFSNQLGVSERTVHSELTLLEEMGYLIERKRGRGVRLVSDDKDLTLEEDGAIDFILERRVDLMKRLLLDGKCVTVRSLSEDFFVSTTSIQHDLDVVEKVLFKGTTCYLESDHRGTRFPNCSMENKLQILVNFNQFIVENAQFLATNLSKEEVLAQYYPENLVKVCQNVLYSFVRDFANTIAESYVESFLLHLIALIYQLSKEAHVEESYSALDHQKHAFYIDSAVKILHKASLRLHFEYDNADVHYLSQLLLNFRFEQMPQDKVDDSLVMEIIAGASQALNIDFSKDQQLVEQLRAHIPAMLSRLRYQNPVRNPFTDQIKLEFSVTFNILWMVAESLSSKIGLQFNEDEIAFLTIYFQLAIEKSGVSRRILVICPTGIVTSELLINRIKNSLPSLDKIEVASIAEANELDLRQYDMVLSTVKLDSVPLRFYQVSPLISSEELGKLFSKVATSPVPSESKNVLSIFLPEDLIFLQSEFTHKEQVIQAVSEVLLDKNMVDEAFASSILERENLGGTDMPIGVAVPHGQPSHVKQTFVTMVQNKRRFKWTEHKVDLVFVIGIAKEDMRKTKEIISAIYQLIQNEESLIGLKNTQKEEVVKILYGTK